MSFNPAWHLAEEEDGLSPESGRGDGPYSEAEVGEAAVVRVEADKDDLPCTNTDKHQHTSCTRRNSPFSRGSQFCAQTNTALGSEEVR